MMRMSSEGRNVLTMTLDSGASQHAISDLCDLGILGLPHSEVEWGSATQRPIVWPCPTGLRHLSNSAPRKDLVIC